MGNQSKTMCAEILAAMLIKKLLAKFPQWGIAVVDGVLVDWNG